MTILLDPDHIGAVILGVTDDAECFVCGDRIVFPAVAWSGFRNPEPGHIVMHHRCAGKLAAALLEDVIG